MSAEKVTGVLQNFEIFSEQLFWRTPVRDWFCGDAHPVMFSKIGVLKNFAKFTGKHVCQGVFLINCQAEAEVWNFIVKEALTQVFFCEKKNSFSNRTPAVAVSDFFLSRKKKKFSKTYYNFKVSLNFLAKDNWNSSHYSFVW